jgi:hypothetical protein
MKERKIASIKVRDNRVMCYDDEGRYMFTRNGKVNSYTEDNLVLESIDGRNKVLDSKGKYKYTR